MVRIFQDKSEQEERDALMDFLRLNQSFITYFRTDYNYSRSKQRWRKNLKL
jgi:hypothetical protein